MPSTPTFFVTSVSAAPKAEFATVTLQTQEEGLPASTLSLVVPIESASDYVAGRAYSVSLSSTKLTATGAVSSASNA